MAEAPLQWGENEGVTVLDGASYSTDVNNNINNSL